MTQILKSLSTMTPQWLQEALTEAGHAPPPIAAVQVRPMDGFVGAMGEVGIVSVTYAGDTDLPSGVCRQVPPRRRHRPHVRLGDAVVPA